MTSNNVQSQINQLKEKSEKLWNERKYDESIVVEIECCSLIKKTFSEESSEYTQCQKNLATKLTQLAVAYGKINDYGKAESLYKQALEIWRTVGENSLDYTSCLNNLGFLYFQTERYADSENLYKQALEILRKIVGEVHEEFGTTLVNLSWLYIHTKKYDMAEPLCKQALEIWRKLLPEEDPVVGRAFNNLVFLYTESGDTSALQSFLQQNMSRIAENKLDPLKKAKQLTRLAINYYKTRKYSEAENLFIQAVEIYRKELGEDDSAYAESIGDLAMLYVETYNYPKAFSLLVKAVDIFEKKDPNNPKFATYLYGLGAEMSRNGTQMGAMIYYQKALEVLGRTCGKDDPRYAYVLDDLASVYSNMGKYSDAEFLIRQSLQIMERKLEKNHHAFAINFGKLADVCLHNGKYPEAESLLKKSLDILQLPQNKDDSMTVAVLRDLANLYIITNRQSESIELLENAISKEDKIIGAFFSYGSEEQRIRFLDHSRVLDDLYINQILQFFSHDKKMLFKAFDVILKRKGLSIEAMALQKNVLFDNKDAVLKEKMDKLNDLRMQITRMTFSNPGPRFDEYQYELEKLNNQKEALEGELVHKIQDIRIEKIFTEVNHNKICEALPKDTVLIEFVQVRGVDFKSPTLELTPSHYLAFILKSSDPDNIDLIDLGETKPIDEMIASYLQTIVENIYNDDRPKSGDIKTESKNSNDGLLLRKSIFDPMISCFGNCKKILLAIDGNLTRIPFEVLPSDGKYLIDDYQFIYLSTARDLLRFQVNINDSPSDSLVLADPDFDLVLTSDKKTGEIDDMYIPGRKNLKFDPLTNTLTEGILVSNLLDCKLWAEQDVLEGNLKACKSPKILHIATHGFFLPDEKSSDKDTILVPWKGGDKDISVPKKGDEGALRYIKINPLIRSGLALAGGNSWNQSKLLPPEAEDGILTAMDVTGLDLAATDLVVLSACETGVGEVHVGEGVFGLRRAFVLAGAKTLVMSLWKVADKETQDLMLEFYNNLLGGQPREDALRNAVLKLKDKKPHPFFWGAFICQGESGPIKLLSTT